MPTDVELEEMATDERNQLLAELDAFFTQQARMEQSAELAAEYERLQ